MGAAYSQRCTTEEALEETTGDDCGDIWRLCQRDLEDDQQKPRQHVDGVATVEFGHRCEQEWSHSKSKNVHGQANGADLGRDIETGRELIFARAIPAGAEAAVHRSQSEDPVEMW